MTCRDPGKSWYFLCDFLEDDIDSPICQELKDHLANCPECRANVESVRRTVALYRQSFPDSALSSKLKKQMLDKLFSG